MEDISVHLIDLPCKVNGLTVLNEDNSYSVFLNARASHEQLLKTYAHELKHIEGSDFFAIGDIQEIEAKRHNQ